MQREKGLRYFPIGLFSSIMGLTGVTIAFKHLEGIYKWNHIISTILLVLTTLIFILNGGMLLYRLFRYQTDVKHDFNNSVKMNFFGAV